MAEVVARFGSGTPQRQEVTERLQRIYDLAAATGRLERFIVFGSSVTANRLFDHEQADREFGASVFWTRPSHLLVGTLQEFIAHWQTKREGGRRGIVEVIG